MCGRIAPRFELLGRFGDVFKFTTNYINYKKIKSIFGEKMNYTDWVQMILSYNETSIMDICVEADLAFSEEDVLRILAQNYPEIAEIVTDRTGRITVVQQNRDQFTLSTGGGKIRSVIDI